MATNQPPASGQNQPGSTPSQKSAVELKDTLKEILRLEGDYRDIVRDSIKELQATLKMYDKMEAKLANINKSAINIKEIESQIKKTTEESSTNTKKLADMQAKLSDEGKKKAKDFNDQIVAIQQKEEGLRNARLAGNKTLEAQISNELKYEEGFLNLLKQDLNVEELKYAQLSKTEELNSEILNRQKAQLEQEKKISSSVGVTGKALGSIAEKLGLGTEFYEKMVEKARENNGELSLTQKASLLWKATTGAISENFAKIRRDPALILVGIQALGKKMGDFAKSAANSVADFQKMSGDQVIGKLAGGISSIVSKIPIVGGLLGGFVEAFAKLLELSLAEDDKITKLGRKLGIAKDEAKRLNDTFLQISLNTKSSIVTVDKLTESYSELVDMFGVISGFSREILVANVELSKLAGLDAKTRAGIMQSSIITGKESEKITKSVIGQVNSLKLATGISFDYKKILSEAANFSGVLGLQFAKYPDKLAKALVETKAMGMELNKLNSIGDSFMNFEESLSKEFEAQLITGKDINLNKAREAFLNNDLATAAKEISKYAGTAADFTKMKRIEQDSLASAMGMSKDELADMLKQQEMLSRLGAADLKQAQAKLENMKAQGMTREQILESMDEETYRSLTNMSAQEKIAGFIEKIQSAVANFLSKSPIIPLVERAIDFLSQPDSITAIVTKIQGVFATIFDIIGSVAAAIMKIANGWPFNAGIDDSIIRLAEAGGDPIRRMNVAGALTVGNNAAQNETAGSGGGSSSGYNTAASNTPTTVQFNVNATLDDNYRTNSGRMKMAAKMGYDTGPFGK